MIRFIPAQVEHVGAIAQVMERAFEPTYGEAWNAAQVAAALLGSETSAEIALSDACPVGFSLARRIVDEVELLLVGVEPGYRNRGLGRQLVGNVARRAEAQGARTLFLEVRESNLPAVKLYKSAGFTQVGRRVAYYAGSNQTRYDALTMSRPLQGGTEVQT